MTSQHGWTGPCRPPKHRPLGEGHPEGPITN
jgi:hypothetical protein